MILSLWRDKPEYFKLVVAAAVVMLWAWKGRVVG